MTSYDLSGRTALVTGGSRGLGRSIALAFAKAGAAIIVSSRKPDACALVVDEIEALGGRAVSIAAHMGRWDDIDRLATAAWDAFGQVDVLVNNAGMSPLAPSSQDTSEDLFDKIVSVNFKGPFRLTALLGARMANGAGGSIINISSIGALKPNPTVTPYAGSKAALNAISLAFAQEFAPKVRVNVISPGGFLTDVAKGWATDEEARAVTALQRWGDADEIVGTALYLASDASSYTTGANIRVDGGSFWDRRP